MQEGFMAIFIMGRRYEVPGGLTILKAMEWSGFKFIRGCGCRGGFCGACATVFRIKGEYKLRVGLACQTTIEENMYITQIPFFPAQKASYNLDEINAPSEILLQLYPEITRCLGCNTCTKVCPQNLKPIDYIAATLRGDWKKAAELSFDCIMCGLCAARCPGELAPYNIAIYVRRYYSKNLRKKPQHLIERKTEILSGKYDEALQALENLDEKSLRSKYEQRDFEKL